MTIDDDKGNGDRGNEGDDNDDEGDRDGDGDEGDDERDNGHESHTHDDHDGRCGHRRRQQCDAHGECHSTTMTMWPQQTTDNSDDNMATKDNVDVMPMANATARQQQRQ